MLARLIAALLGLTACAAQGAPQSDFTACARQQAQCEASCPPGLLPGSSEKEPALRGDIEADRCRERCRSCPP